VRRVVQLAVAVVALGALIATAAWAEEAKGGKGKEIFTQYRCMACHSVKAQAIEKKAVVEEEEAPAAGAAAAKKKPPDLSGVGVERDAAWMTKWLLKQEKIDGLFHKKKFRGTDAELKSLTDWLATLKTDEKGNPKKAAAKVEATEKTETPAKVEATTKPDSTAKLEPTAPTEGAK